MNKVLMAIMSAHKDGVNQMGPLTERIYLDYARIGRGPVRTS